MVNKVSFVDQAYEILLSRYTSLKDKFTPMPFNELLDGVANKSKSTDEEKKEMASRFYTALTVDGRFVIKENNTWVLKEKELYENVHIDMNGAYSDVENEEKELLEDYQNDDEDDNKSFADESDDDKYEDDNIINPNLDDENEDDE